MPTVTLTVKLAPPDKSPISIFHVGQAFYLAGNRCLLSIDVGPDVTQCLTTPSVTNFCFSIELFFKSLLAADGREIPKTHKLQELFGLLATDDREAIALAYHAVVSEPKLDELVAIVSEFFVKLRYEYEFEVFALQEFPVVSLAKSAYVRAAKVHGVKTSHERIQL
jgi:hypothetical protein